jgi:hypothetical protein
MAILISQPARLHTREALQEAVLHNKLGSDSGVIGAKSGTGFSCLNLPFFASH